MRTRLKMSRKLARLNCCSYSGISADKRTRLAAIQADRAQAKLALSIYAHRVRQSIGSLAVAIGGIDALVFTAGVGEHAVEVREMVCSGLECLGVNLDQQANQRLKADADIASSTSRCRVLIIATRENVTML